MKILSINNLTFAYSSNDRVILDDVSFDINEGEYVSILGPNGSGKSTLARLLIGLLKAKSGMINVEGLLLSPENVNEIRKKVGIVFQDPDNQFIGATVEDDIAFGLENRNMSREEMKKTVHYFANKVGMEAFLDKEPSNLSGGQKQRVAIAGVLALKPDILILDEATSMLDPTGRKDILNLINDIKKERPSLTVLSITHDIEEAYNSDKVLVLYDGKVVLYDEPKNVFKSSNNLEQYSLSLPFIFELKEQLNNAGIDVKDKKTLKEIEDVLCQLK